MSKNNNEKTGKASILLQKNSKGEKIATLFLFNRNR